MTQTDIGQILTEYETVAIVGLSRDPSKDSYKVAEYLKKHGYRIIPVNPTTNEILEQKSYKSLVDIPTETQKTLQIVDIFRPSADIMPIVEQAIQIKRLYSVPYVIWMQLGIVNEQAAEAARKTGFTVIMDKCMMQQHRRIFGDDETFEKQ